MEKKDLQDILALLPKVQVAGTIEQVEPLRVRIGELMVVVQKELEPPKDQSAEKKTA